MIIGNLDEDGYLRVPLLELQEDAQCSLAHLEQILRQIQAFDPPGVGAKNLAECLLIQLGHFQHDEMAFTHHFSDTVSKNLVSAIIKDHLTDLQK